MGSKASWFVLVVAFACVGVVGLVVVTPGQAAACSCVSLTDEEAMTHADAVFTGTLLEAVVDDGDTYSSTDPERFVFEVERVFKGEVRARQSIVTAREGASCGLEIAGPGPFLVFARAESDGLTRGAVDGEYYSSLCSGTRALAAAAIPATFGAAVAPNPGTSPVSGSESAGAGVWIVAGVTVVVLATVGGVVAIRRRAT